MVNIDRNNGRILQELARDGRISNSDLAERLGISPSTCLRRVQELEKSGVIKGYRAILDREAMGTSFVAYTTVGLSDHSKASQQGFEDLVSLSPQVRECHNVTGSIEYILRIEVSDLNAYKHFHTEVLGTLPQVNSITSYVVMESPKDERQ